MRVLVTNSHTPQACAIVRALRPLAQAIVTTVEGILLNWAGGG